MKAIMYHYVRQGSAELPHFHYLHVDDFVRQLDDFADSYRFVGRDEFLDILDGAEVPADGLLLTFDDGLADHFDFVYPILKERGLWGFFFIPTGVHETGQLLDVHRIHQLLGAFGGERMQAELEAYLQETGLNVDSASTFDESRYAPLVQDAATTSFKLKLNYQMPPADRKRVLDGLMAAHFDEAELTAQFYMSPEQLAHLEGEGMIVGSHSVNHPVMSRLTVEEQRAEIDGSFAFLASVLPELEPRTFCFPYGGVESFTGDTLRLLAEAGCRCAFSVDRRDITTEAVHDSVLALPRHNCNQFTFGTASKGMGMRLENEA